MYALFGRDCANVDRICIHTTSTRRTAILLGCKAICYIITIKKYK